MTIYWISGLLFLKHHVSELCTLGVHASISLGSGLLDFALRSTNNILDVATSNDIHGNFQRLLTDIMIRRRLGAKNVHQEFLQNAFSQQLNGFSISVACLPGKSVQQWLWKLESFQALHVHSIRLEVLVVYGITKKVKP